MSITKQDISTAPRDKDQLIALGRFPLRTLASALGLISTEDAKSAFMSQAVDKQAEAILSALKAYDAQGSAPAMAPPPASVAESAPKRTPRTSAAPETPPNGAGSTDVGAVSVVLSELGKVLQNQQLSDKKADGLVSAVERLATAMERLEKVASVQLGLNLLFAEQTLGGGREDILEAALSDGQELVASLTGKGKKGK